MPGLIAFNIRCDGCQRLAPTEFGGAHFEDVRLAALSAGWEMDSRHGDLCPECHDLGPPGLIPHPGRAFPEFLFPRLVLPMGQQASLDQAMAAVAISVLLLATRSW